MGIVALTDIQKFVADVAREFLPEKAILFGSYATGSAKAESDVDLLVVMREDVSGVRVAADIITRLKPTLPVELVVRSSRQIKARTRTLQSGHNVVEAVDGKLIESHPDGSFAVLRSLAAPIPVAPGQIRVRKSR